MSRNKEKNQYGTFATDKSKNNKTVRILITALLAVIFVLGIGAALFNKSKKPKQQAAVETSPAGQIPGWWYQQYFGSSVCEKDNCKPDADPDNDGLTNVQEFYYHTNPLNSFTSKDKLNDGQLVSKGFDPSRQGHMTFDQISAPENLLGESLVFSKDIQQIVAQANDINKVSLPLVKDDQLQIADSHDTNAYSTYPARLQSVIDKYFTKSNISNLKDVLNTGSEADINDLKLKSATLAIELTKLPVPIQFLMFHKYTIVLFQLLPKVITPPASLTSTESDVWYDNFQSFLATQQKLDLEELRLKQITSANP